ncbi:DUF5375 family protein [Yersinia proxima]|uniref:DUF5375 family protein n=1 Tax=Yersinia proxima TaxID=2890316 RepID=UPI001D1258B8|nr:DUF5375 family protein [Yersinia proxima]
MNTPNQSSYPVDVRIAVYCRAVAQTYLAACAADGMENLCTLDSLQHEITQQIETFFVHEFGPEVGTEIACSALRDMVSSDVLTHIPRLTLLGEVIMDSICCTQNTATQSLTTYY